MTTAVETDKNTQFYTDYKINGRNECVCLCKFSQNMCLFVSVRVTKREIENE